ncbi:MAG: hypothetical protein P4L46_04905 [Fimbriimonas sp.]|nr:hypothetical protein [Fimbriimonas sp.]
MNKGTVIAIALGVVGVIALAALARETLSGPPGESRNPNYGHPSPVAHGAGRAGASGANLDKEQYYNNLKLNRPDLSEQELRDKTDHWWKVKHGDDKVAGG